MKRKIKKASLKDVADFLGIAHITARKFDKKKRILLQFGLPAYKENMEKKK